MMHQPIILQTSDRAQPLNVLGVNVSVLAANTNTGGYEITLQKGEVGMGPPPHSHAWDESFFVLSGIVEFSYGSKTASCSAGTLVHIPGGTVHAFQFGADGGEMLEISSAGGLATQMFSDIADTISAESPDMGKAVEVLQSNGVTVHV